MSWSVSFIGTPEKVAEALEGYVEQTKMEGYSKVEYEKALPHMVGLVKQNFGNGKGGLVHVVANGHGYVTDGVPQSGTCNVEVKQLYGALV